MGTAKQKAFFSNKYLLLKQAKFIGEGNLNNEIILYISF
jgi:hypothetical protein